jgi:hypothetical protein
VAISRLRLRYTNLNVYKKQRIPGFSSKKWVVQSLGFANSPQEQDAARLIIANQKDKLR